MADRPRIDVTHIVAPWTDQPLVSTADFCVVGMAPRASTLSPVTLLLRVVGRHENRRIVRVISILAIPGPHVGPREEPLVWGMRRIAPTVWTLDPSIVADDGLHAFLTMTAVPDPAPWSDMRQDQSGGGNG